MVNTEFYFITAGWRRGKEEEEESIFCVAEALEEENLTLPVDIYHLPIFNHSFGNVFCNK